MRCSHLISPVSGDHRDELAPALFGPEPRAAATAAAEVGLARPELGRVGLEEAPPLLARVEVEQLRARDCSWATSSCGRRPRRARSNRCRRASAPDRDSAPAGPSCRSPSPRSASRMVWRAGIHRSAGRARSGSRCGSARRPACGARRTSNRSAPESAWRPSRACRAA